MMMNRFLSFVKKEFLHIFRDRRTLLILLGMPVAQIILFGFAITTEIKESAVAVLDSSHDRLSLRLVQRIDASDYFNIEGYHESGRDILNAFRKGEADIAVVFGSSFSRNLERGRGAEIQLIADASDPNRAVSLVAYMSGIIASFLEETAGDKGYPSGTGVEKKGSGARITTVTRLLYNPEMKSSFNFVPGVMGMILMLICAMMTSIAIVREKETGSMEVLLSSPVRPILIILAKAVPYFTLSCINLVTILFLSVFLLGVPASGSMGALAGISLVFIFVSLSLGLFVSTITSTQVAAMLISGMALMMPVMILSGMIFPVENMPVFLQHFSKIIPARWYISAVKKLMIKGLGASSVVTEISVLSVMAAAFIAVSLKKFKKRLE